MNSPETISTENFEISRRPFKGLALLSSSVIGTVAVLIFLGAWASEKRIEDRAISIGKNPDQIQAEWWEDSLLFVCPVH